MTMARCQRKRGNSGHLLQLGQLVHSNRVQPRSLQELKKPRQVLAELKSREEASAALEKAAAGKDMEACSEGQIRRSRHVDSALRRGESSLYSFLSKQSWANAGSIDLCHTYTVPASS